MTLLCLILSNLHCLLSEAAFPGTQGEASSLKTDINTCQMTIHLQWAESWPGTWVLQAFWDTWLISLSNHLTVFLYLQDVNFVGCVCVPKYMCVYMRAWTVKDELGFQMQIPPHLSKTECTRSACFKVKITRLWFTLTDWYKKFSAFPTGFLTYTVSAFLQSTNKWGHNWRGGTCGLDALIRTLFSTGRVWRWVSWLLKFKYKERQPRLGEAAGWLPRGVRHRGFFWISGYQSVAQHEQPLEIG